MAVDGSGDVFIADTFSNRVVEHAAVPTLPTGVTLWAGLYTQVAGSWGNWQDVAFTVSASRAVFTYPTAGQQNIDTVTPFAWSPVTGAQAYRLTIATTPGAIALVRVRDACRERQQLLRAGASGRF